MSTLNPVKKSLTKGIFFSLAACFFWGFIFVAPLFMKDFSPVDIVIGRYFFYGFASLILFIRFFVKKKADLSYYTVKKALLFSLLGTIGYYLCLVLGIRYSNPAVSALLVSISPITIAIYGNYKNKDLPYKKLAPPTLLILIGIVLINYESFKFLDTSSSFLLGILFTSISVGIWTWYVVKNAKFLNKQTFIKPLYWATLIGVGSLFWSLLFFSLIEIFHTTTFDLLNFFHKNFLVSSAILGLLSSFLGAYLWNKACFHLPVSLAGHLSIFETIFGLIFFYIIEKKIPSLLELFAISILITAVYYALEQFRKIKRKEAESEPHL
jgi:drug/metabolite transporter (DMT)-like permease